MFVISSEALVLCLLDLMKGGRDGKHAFAGIHLFSSTLLAFVTLQTKQVRFPQKCHAQSVIFFISFGVFIYLFFFLFNWGKSVLLLCN